MKYAFTCITVLIFLCSCLVGPLPTKEKIKPAGFSRTVTGGDLRSRLEKSLAALDASVRDIEALFQPDSAMRAPYRVGDALLGLTLTAGALDTVHPAAARIFGMLPARLPDLGRPGGLLPDRADERVLAGYARCIGALSEYYRANGEAAALDMAQGIVDSLFIPMLDLLDDYPGPGVARINVYFETDSLSSDSAAVARPAVAPGPVTVGGWTLCDKYGELFTAVDPLARLYGYRPDPGTRRVLDALLSLYNDVKEDFPGKGTAGFLGPIRGMLRFDGAMGESRYGQQARAAWDLFAGTALTKMYGSGRTTPEGFGIVCPEDASEAYIAAMYLWVDSGRGEYLQQAEKILLNSVMPAQQADGRFTYLQTDTLDGRLSRYAGGSYGSPAAWVEALPTAAEFSYFTRDNKILIPLYGSSEYVSEDRKTRLVQSSGYPLDSIIRLEVVDAPSRGVGLQLYFPSYMTARSITRNGTEPLSGTVNTIGLLQMKEVYRKGDVIELKYAFAPKWTEARDDGTPEADLYKAVFGPLLLGYRAGEMMWLERGVPLRGRASDGFALNPEFTYGRDTLTGRVLVNPDQIGEPYDPPGFRPMYTPINNYGAEDILPEYFLVKIGRD